MVRLLLDSDVDVDVDGVEEGVDAGHRDREGVWMDGWIEVKERVSQGEGWIEGNDGVVSSLTVELLPLLSPSLNFARCCPSNDRS